VVIRIKGKRRQGKESTVVGKRTVLFQISFIKLYIREKRSECRFIHPFIISNKYTTIPHIAYKLELPHNYLLHNLITTRYHHYIHN